MLAGTRREAPDDTRAGASPLRTAVDLADDELDFLFLRRVPGLALPFALVGASAGLFSVLGLAAVRDTARSTSPIVAAAVATLAGAIAGAVLRRWPRLYDPLVAMDGVVLRVAAVVLPAAGFVGAVVGGTTWGEAGLLPCAAGGALCGLAFLPSCVAVLGAAKRAMRARHGSLVADADRRTAWGSLLGVVAIAALAQAPALALGRVSELLHPLAQVGLSLVVGAVCAVALFALRALDRAGHARLGAIASDAVWLERADVGANGDAESGAVDLGLGDERWSRSPHLATYRSASRNDVVLRGSVEDALAAFGDAIRRRRRALAAAVATVLLTAAAFACGAEEAARAAAFVVPIGGN
jgi:hypothetical protein